MSVSTVVTFQLFYIYVRCLDLRTVSFSRRHDIWYSILKRVRKIYRLFVH